MSINAGLNLSITFFINIHNICLFRINKYDINLCNLLLLLHRQNFSHIHVKFDSQIIKNI